MKIPLRKIGLSAIILTTAFAVVVFTAASGGIQGDYTLVFFGSVAMAAAVAVAAVVWSKPSSESDDANDDS